MAKKTKMLNFPISLLSNFLSCNDARVTIYEILCWGAYNYGNAEEERDVKHFVGGAKFLDIEKTLRELDILECCIMGESLSHHNDNPKTGLSVTLLLDWFYNGQNKTQREKLTLLAFASVKSMFADNKTYIKTNENFFFARMAGLSHAIKSIDDLPNDIATYYKNHRHWRNELMNDLVLDFGLKYYSTNGVRGFYLSFKLPIEKLVEVALGETRKAKLKKIEKQKREAEQKFYNENKP